MRSYTVEPRFGEASEVGQPCPWAVMAMKMIRKAKGTLQLPSDGKSST